MYSSLCKKLFPIYYFMVIVSISQLNGADFILSEISDAVSTASEFIEIKNLTSIEQNLNHFKLARVVPNSNNTSTIFEIGIDSNGDTLIPANGYLVISRGDERSTFLTNFPNFPENASFYIGKVNLQIAGEASGWRWRLLDADDNVIDDTFEEVAGIDKRTIQTSLGVFTTSESVDGVNSTPGEGEESSLPVCLNYFSANFIDGEVNLKWETGAEVENLGFNIYRKSESDDYLLLTGFQTNSQLNGYGSVSESKNYSYIDDNIILGKSYKYMLSDIDNSYNETLYTELVQSVTIPNSTEYYPENYILGAAYPNPFNSNLVVPITLKEKAFVSIYIYDCLGYKMNTIVQETINSGSYSFSVNGDDLMSGLYFIRISIMANITVQKVILLK